MKIREKLKQIKWPTLIAIGLIHLGALLAPWTFSWKALALCLALYWLTGGVGITLGFHRLFAHNSFKLSKIVAYPVMVCGTLAGQGGALSWIAAHRTHHKYSDQKGKDPHTPRDGFFWSHMGWLFKRTILDDIKHYKQMVPDLIRDPFYRFLNRYNGILIIALGILLYLWGGLSYLVWGFAVRMVLLYHSTWFVNSATHKWGYRSYKTSDDSRNLWWVSLLSFGEGWHNNHHAFQGSARHGLRWWEVDVTYLQIRLLALLGLAREIKVPSSALASEAA